MTADPLERRRADSGGRTAQSVLQVPARANSCTVASWSEPLGKPSFSFMEVD